MRVWPFQKILFCNATAQQRKPQERVWLLTAMLVSVFLLACGGKQPQDTETDPAKRRITKKNARQVLADYAAQHPDSVVVIETQYGIIKLRLYAGTPLHRASFVRLVRKGFFDTASFYRLVPGMVVQGGYADKTRLRTENYEVPFETDPQYYHKRGALGMAHHDGAKGSSPFDFYIVQGTVLTEDSVRAANENTGLPLLDSQLRDYVSTGGAPHLDYRYTVFGEVIDGIGIVDSIAAEVLVLGTERPKRKIPAKISLQ